VREDYRLLTPENVELRYDVAGLGSRLGAALIDYTIIMVGYIAIFLGAAMFTAFVGQVAPPPRDLRPFFDNAAIAAGLALGFFGWWGYFLLFELLWGGQSPGKRALGLRVVRRDGQPLGATAALVRNTLRWIDQVLLLGVFVMLIDSASRRLGDMAAGTLVVREPRALQRQAFETVAMPEVPEAWIQALPNAGRITTTEYTVIRDYFARAGNLGYAESGRLATTLASELARKLEVEPGTIGDPERFLATVARAFEARHRYGDTALPPAPPGLSS
jgi:uncharacterized RDD family membrane protein YckC